MSAVVGASPARRPGWLRPDVSRLNLATLLFGSFVSIALVVFVNIGQPYVLVENLGIRGAEGRITGGLTLAGELVTLLCIGYVGVLNDRIGRRPVIVAGALLMGLAYALMPLAASIAFLFLVRVLLAFGTTAETSTITTIMQDYAAEHARGKVVALVGVLMGIGVVVLNLLVGGLPARFVAAGHDAVAAGQFTHWVVAGVCLASALLFRAGFAPGTPLPAGARLGQRELLRRGLAAGRRPRVALAFAAAFVSRSDLVVIGTFVLLWGTVAGRAAGLDTAAAVLAATKVFAITQTAGLLTAPLLGYMTDRLDRVTALGICALLGAVGYLGMAFVADPLDAGFLPLLLLLGIGQTACNLGAQALVGQESDDGTRGVVIGGFGVCGTLGIMVTTWAGGMLFDLWRPAAPFVFVGALTAMLCAAAFGLRARERAAARTPATVA